jgi:uncharacterized protein DUF3443
VHRTLLLAFVVAQAITPQCGGSPSTASPVAVPAQNVQAIVVNAGPANSYFNGAFTSVTICVPGQATACQTIDGVLVDTGSSGLRVLSSALSLRLPQQTGTSGAPIAECLQFLDGFTWGPVQGADVKLSGEAASAVPIQVIGASGFSTIPADCANSGTPEDTLASLGANGILGIGLFRQDCGIGCAFVGSSNPGLYYECSSLGCQTTAVPLTKQVQNPVWLFPKDNNGIVLQLPPVPIGGALSAIGALVFGVGTQANNALGSATVLTVDAGGNFTTAFGSRSYGSSYIDAGSNGVYFLDSATTGLPLCPDNSVFYCPLTRQTLSATNRGVNGATSAVTFGVGNSDLLNVNFSAFSDVGGPNPGGFDWGLAFFFGRSVFTAIEGQSTPGGQGPYFAY